MSEAEETQLGPASEEEKAPEKPDLKHLPDEMGWWLWWQPKAKKPHPCLVVPVKGGELHACWLEHHRRVELVRRPVAQLDGTWRRWVREMEPDAHTEEYNFRAEMLSMVLEIGDKVTALDVIIEQLDPIDCLRAIIRLAKKAGLDLSGVTNEQ